MVMQLIGANYAGRKGRGRGPARVCHANAANVCPTLVSHKSYEAEVHRKNSLENLSCLKNNKNTNKIF